jgi:2-methylcitrate dehydratase
MINHEVRVYKSAENLERKDQLAYKIAQVAADPVAIESEVADMVINRVIDNASVAAASVNRKAPTHAREQALPHKLEPGATVFGQR